MSRVAVIATLEVDTATFEDVKTRVLEHRERCLASEPGTLMFELMLPRDEPGRMYLYEVYADQAAFDVHWHGESIARLRRETEGRLRIASGIWGTPAN
jgi:quinol monooxygenase YgiN